MKIFIAHRGNINGRNESRENSPEYISEALSEGFDVEVDIWGVDGYLFLGHDEPQYIIDDETFISDPRLWIHCKNIEAMEYLTSIPKLNAFAHKDDIIITPNGYLWTAPGYPITTRSIAVMPELTPHWDFRNAIGLCSDYLLFYRLHEDMFFNNNI